MQPTAFDQYAADYDAEFTHSAVGTVQRRQVWKALMPYLSRSPEILEVNCGTGEDAIRLARTGATVLATDISAEMIRIAGAKRTPSGAINPDFLQAGFLDLTNRVKGRSFDLIFSNFGGLNCLSPEETRTAVACFYQLLNPGGRLFLVYMSRHCLWESLYFRWKGQRQVAVRRHAGFAEARIGREKIGTWYYTPGELKALYQSGFMLLDLRPVGLCVPPSYLEGWAGKRTRWLKIMEKADRLLNFSALADYADHFVITFEKKPENIG
ncbi:MAG TPA: methyltransferase domain-containing protein [Flavilitoribacter sp.]|mgnify:CR=1 FL=1|nr:methyltransferase domain-containing protein [Flavilitoribacter sp.]HMQ87722.1 methyltransferase domain-containing protein [Flavilitoribacter sp.]